MKKNHWVWLSIVLMSLVILSIFLFVIPFPYTVSESYIEEVPYETTESYQDMQLVMRTECEETVPRFVVKLGETGKQCLNNDCSILRVACSVVVTSMDDIGGRVELDTYNTESDLTAHPWRHMEITIAPLDTYTFRWDWEVPTEDFGVCYYDNFIAQPVRDCEDSFQNVVINKTRPVVKVRSEERKRNVTVYDNLISIII